jgi:23S rRNA (guanine2445-N2)-methyltransferase / 23S rRNA (guanine2069-N7)-methyltransferase
MPLGEFELRSDTDIYDAAAAVDWQMRFTHSLSFAVDVAGKSSVVNHTQYAALRVKDAIVDHYKAVGPRPNVDTVDPDWRAHLALKDKRAVLSLDLAGGSLHERGYRKAQGGAPLKENLAAAVLLRCGWPAIAADGGALVDPMCGSGTFLIEGAWIAADIAPQILRNQFAFECWAETDAKQVKLLREEIDERRVKGLKNLRSVFFGFDADPAAIAAAKRNVAAAELSGHVRLHTNSLDALKRPESLAAGGLVVCNPPYGERLLTPREALAVHQQLGNTLREEFSDQQAGVITGSEDLVEALHTPVRKRYALYNGALPATLALLNLTPRAHVGEKKLSDGAQMVANRIEKNLLKTKAWRERDSITCFRAYDADLPEYSAAVDVYEGRLHIQEYLAPKEIPESVTQKRFLELKSAASKVFGVGDDKIYSKMRQRQKGTKQYTKRAESGEFIEVGESGLRFLVNLEDYLDSGLFLDSRSIRLKVRELAKGKRFLNLFCYTGSASVYAADGGASVSLSIDLSPRYVEWAAENFQLNELEPYQHRVLQADVMTWLRSAREKFDLIYVDPPTFSNSKRTDTVFEVERDHGELLALCGERLNDGGEMIFVTNKRKFVLDPSVSETWDVQPIKHSVPLDFARDPEIHKAFLLRKLT